MGKIKSSNRTIVPHWNMSHVFTTAMHGTFWQRLHHHVTGVGVASRPAGAMDKEQRVALKPMGLFWLGPSGSLDIAPPVHPLATPL